MQEIVKIEAVVSDLEELRTKADVLSKAAAELLDLLRRISEQGIAVRTETSQSQR